ncbi:hypothetical protein [Winogradskyella sp. R77965]|uniref:hypothetical protein n=1 Tax=Winogradskyella sp. R77965 TaxID=3093872 RepID=UPI0037DCEDD2
MIGDKLTYYSNYKKINNEIIVKLKNDLLEKRVCIAVGGESGSGKTSLAYALFIDIEKELGLKGFLFHGDDYFKLPPKDNHNKRLENITNVGPSEVSIELLDKHLKAYIKNEGEIEKPIVNYDENSIGTETIHTNDYNFCIVELTYAMLLKQPTFKIFIENSYIDTKENRTKRARDIMNKFNESVLEIEHNIIKEHFVYADLTIKKGDMKF